MLEKFRKPDANGGVRLFAAGGLVSQIGHETYDLILRDAIANGVPLILTEQQYLVLEHNGFFPPVPPP